MVKYSKLIAIGFLSGFLTACWVKNPTWPLHKKTMPSHHKKESQDLAIISIQGALQ